MKDTKCEWCKGTTRGDTCPKSIVCPSCNAAAGANCKRPSGHTCPQLHKDRINAAYAIDDANGFDWKSVYADMLVSV
jgi:hypothetical protein